MFPKTKEGKSILFLFSITMLVSLSLIVVGIRLQNTVWENTNKLKFDLAKSMHYSEDKLENYISNQEYLKKQWWNTIINQSGLSVIVTLIVLIVTISFGYINKQNIDEQHKIRDEQHKIRIEESNNKYALKIRELEESNQKVINDLLMLLTEYIESPTCVIKYYDVLKTNINRLNSFLDLKTLNKDITYKLHNKILNDVCVVLFSSVALNF